MGNCNSGKNKLQKRSYRRSFSVSQKIIEYENSDKSFFDLDKNNIEMDDNERNIREHFNAYIKQQLDNRKKIKQKKSQIQRQGEQESQQQEQQQEQYIQESSSSPSCRKSIHSVPSFYFINNQLSNNAKLLKNLDKDMSVTRKSKGVTFEFDKVSPKKRNSDIVVSQQQQCILVRKKKNSLPLNLNLSDYKSG